MFARLLEYLMLLPVKTYSLGIETDGFLANHGVKIALIEGFMK